MSLGFFSADVSSSESEVDENEGIAKLEENVNPGADDDDKLPSPDTLFATVGRPTFLNDTGSVHVDWDKYAKSLNPPTEENVHEKGHYTAIPPPPSSDATQVSAPPVRYSPQAPPSPNDGDEGEHPSPTSEEPSAAKRPLQADGETSKKKQKVETFRQKEKRKRDLGMSSRGKNYVEEEKRVLREQYGPLGVGD